MNTITTLPYTIHVRFNDFSLHFNDFVITSQRFRSNELVHIFAWY